VPGIVLLLGILWDKDGSCPECLSFFLINAALTLLSSSASFSIGHAENVVSLNTAVNTAVTWDRISELLRLVLGFFNSVKHTKSIFV
jgi:hypothetical protein